MSALLRRARNKGYTLIEVMMAIGIMTVGAVGIMSLQQAATAANVQAHNYAAGTQLTRIWLERLRVDGLHWVIPGAAGLVDPLAANSSGMQYLQDAATLGVADNGTWRYYSPRGTDESWAFDFRGYDTRTSANMRFCSSVRLKWLFGGAALRTDVRTWWHRYARTGRADYAAWSSFSCPASVGSAGTNASDVAAAVNTALQTAGPLRSVNATNTVRPIEL